MTPHTQPEGAAASGRARQPRDARAPRTRAARWVAPASAGSPAPGGPGRRGRGGRGRARRRGPGGERMRPRPWLRPSRRLAAGRPAPGRRRRRPGSPGGSPRAGSPRSRSRVDREEITVVGTLPTRSPTRAEAEGRIGRFRSETREERIAIADEAERRFGRKVAWGARLGDTDRAVHPPRRPGHDPAAPARATGARHPRRRRCRPVPLRRPRLVRAARRRAHRGLAGAAARRDGRGRQAARRRSGDLTSRCAGTPAGSGMPPSPAGSVVVGAGLRDHRGGCRRGGAA